MKINLAILLACRQNEEMLWLRRLYVTHAMKWEWPHPTFAIKMSSKQSKCSVMILKDRIRVWSIMEKSKRHWQGNILVSTPLMKDSHTLMIFVSKKIPSGCESLQSLPLASAERPGPRARELFTFSDWPYHSHQDLNNINQLSMSPPLGLESTKTTW